MCRIVGGLEFSIEGKREDSLFANIEKMRDSMALGGPDGAGVYFAKDTQVALGHRRLSIIDLSAFSNQPFVSDDGRFALVFNGEIYNYKEIAKSLQKLGVKCQGMSDTEVVMASFIHYGVECVHYFDGMFAFVVWDNLEQKLYVFRDRYGVKPLYYYFTEQCFLFASELKALFAYPKLKKQINKEVLSYFFAFGYIPAPFSILESCYKLENGHYLVIDSKKKFEKVCYYNLADSFYCKKDLDRNHLLFLLERSVKRRMVSDVPVGVCLSGGVDSSLVCATLKALGYTFESFSIGFKEAQFDESSFAKQVAKHLAIKNHCFTCLVDEAKALIEKIPFVYDEPFGDSSAIPTLLLAQNIAKTHKVALSADGGDELMLGYDRYYWATARWEQYKTWRECKVVSALLSCLSVEMVVAVANILGISLGVDKFLRIKNQLKSQSFLEHYLVEISHFRKEDLQKNQLPFLKQTSDNSNDSFAMMSYFDFSNYLSEDILSKTDRASMYNGLEMREPFLGFELVDYVVGLDSDIKQNKVLFKQILEAYLPKELIYRPKMGFGVPLESWFRGELRGEIDSVLEYATPYLDMQYIKNLLSAFDAGKRVDFAKVWYIYTFCAWRKQWRI